MSHRSAAFAIAMAAGLTGTAAAQDTSRERIPCEAVESIGTAQMADDGTITLRLRSLRPDPVAEGELSFAPGDPRYEDIKQHLGGMTPGAEKPVKPWC